MFSPSEIDKIRNDANDQDLGRIKLKEQMDRFMEKSSFHSDKGLHCEVVRHMIDSLSKGRRRQFFGKFRTIKS